MIAIVHALLFLLIGAVLYYVPGRLMVDLWLREPAAEETFPFSLGLGIVVVNTFVVLVAGVAGLFSSWASVTTVAVVGGSLLVTVALLLLRAKRVKRPWRDLVRRPTRTQMGLWGLAAFSFVFFLVHYDRDLLKEDGCNAALSGALNLGYIGTHVVATADGSDANIEKIIAEAIETNDFLSGRSGQRLGTSMLLAPANALFGQMGFRLVYALQGLLLPALGFLLGRFLFGRTWAGWVTAVLLTFCPWALESRTFDENFIANTFGALTLALLLRKFPAAALAGVAMSLFLGNRHLELVVVPVVLLYLWKHGGGSRGASRRARRAFLGCLVASLLPYIIYHVLFVSWHGGGLFEATYERPPAPHSFFGVEMHFTGLLNWPFMPEPLRAPYHAYPTLVAFPLEILRRFGYVLVALVPAGLAYLWSRRPKLEQALLVVWFVPLLLMVMMQSNWINQNKMGIPATAAVSLVLWMVGGVVLMLDRKRSLVQRFAPPAVGLALALGLTPLLQSPEAPVDERVQVYQESYMDDEWPAELTRWLEETPSYVAMDRERFHVAPWPRPEVSHEWRPALMARQWRSFVDDLSRPWFRSYRNAMPDFIREVHWGFHVGISPIRAMRAGEKTPDIETLGDTSPVAPDPVEGETFVLWLDVSDSPLTLAAPLAPGPDPGGAPQLLTEPGVIDIVAGLDAPWTLASGAALHAARDRDGTIYLIVAPGKPNRSRRPSWLRVREHEASVSFPERRIPIRLPRNAVVRIVELRCYRPTRWYSRFVLIKDGELSGTQTIPVSPS